MARLSLAGRGLLAAILFALPFPACSAGGTAVPASPGAGGEGGDTGAGGSAASSGSQPEGGSNPGGDGGTSGNGGTSAGGTSGSGQAGGTPLAGSGGGGPVDKCGNTFCGPTELCDPAHLGYDDNCNGQVDEGCDCVYGQSHWCFAGDPLLRFAPGCEDGIERCTENGDYGACLGGKQAIKGATSCVDSAEPCTDIKAAPFTTVKLNQGTKGFSTDADPGSESYEVACPASVANCPAVGKASSSGANFQPLQSGEYGVTYTKKVNGETKTCNFALFVGTSGLRVELSWDNAGLDSMTPNGAKGPDLDLHLHRPGTTSPWGVLAASGEDCSYRNCRSDNFSDTPDTPGVSWFSGDPAAPPPHSWTNNADKSQNTCYDAPRGAGGEWEALGKGCHNPRLDIDNFACDATVTDPSDALFCAPENINLDEVPSGSWFRVGVHYRSVCSKLDTHPVVTIYCGGSQVAQVGSTKEAGQLKPSGYAAPVTFSEADCGERFWLAADVFVKQSDCALECTVRPIFSDATAKKPYYMSPKQADAGFGPPYPAAP
jgi:hypothetical protein